MSNRGKMLSAIVGIAIGAFAIPSARAAGWYVSGGSGQALQATIDAASPGDTIVVGPGTYSVHRYFFVTKPLHILSEKGPQLTTIANTYQCIGVGGPCYGSNGFIMYYSAKGIFTIAGFTIRGHRPFDWDITSGRGIEASAPGTIRDNVFDGNEVALAAFNTTSLVRIENNLFHNNFQGIRAEDSESLEIRHNSFVHNTWQIEIRLYKGAPSSVTIANNILVNGYRGIMVNSPAIVPSISCNDVWNNREGNYYDQVSDRTGIDGNISLDPLLCNGYYLHLGSPCLGANTPTLCSGDHMGCYPVACEVATEKQSWGKVKSVFR